jgi:hypothetical protein
MPYRVCTKCGRSKPLLSDFYPNRYGFNHRCKKCVSVETSRRKQEHRKLYPEQQRAYDRYRSRKLRLEFIESYGGKCRCCGESNFEFLTLEHKNKDGASHRREVGEQVVRWLKRMGWPKDNYEILCANCNHAKGVYGYCPHDNENCY